MHKSSSCDPVLRFAHVYRGDGMNECVLDTTSQESPFGGLSLKSILCLLASLEPFEGFLTPSEGGKFLQLPRAFLRLLFRLTGAAVKVVLYVFEHTWGYQDYDGKRKLTLDEVRYGRKRVDGTRMDAGTGLSKGAARSALREAQAIGLITCDIDDRDRARILTRYGIHVRHLEEAEQEEHQHPGEEKDASARDTKSGPPAEQQTPDRKNSTIARGTKNGPLGSQKYPSAGQKVDPGGSKSGPRSEKDTLERDSMKDTSGKKDSAQSRVLSFHPESIDVGPFRTATWSPETLLALVSAVLRVPDRTEMEALGDEVAIAGYYANWYKPATRILAKTAFLSPALAWQRIDLVTRYMTTPGSPSWWQHRKTRAPITLKHIADNFNLQWSDLDQRQWHPEVITPYDGPGYEAGYSGPSCPKIREASAFTGDAIEVVAGSDFAQTPRITQKLEPGQADLEDNQAIEEGPRTDEVVAASPPPPSPQISTASLPIEESPSLLGMQAQEAQDLADLITRQHPTIQGEFVLLEDGSYAIQIEDGSPHPLHIRHPYDWLCPPPVNQRRIERATVFGESLSNTAGQECDVGQADKTINETA